jgi:hypothetical protein
VRDVAGRWTPVDEQRDAVGSGREEPVVRLAEHGGEADEVTVGRGEADLERFAWSRRAVGPDGLGRLRAGLEHGPRRDVLDPDREVPRGSGGLGHRGVGRQAGRLVVIVVTRSERERADQQSSELHVPILFEVQGRG